MYKIYLYKNDSFLIHYLEEEENVAKNCDLINEWQKLK